ncbi:MAG: APC family permease [Acidobacteria bacterium]|nr:APC family permease [Acidobacteriota bacterium]
MTTESQHPRKLTTLQLVGLIFFTVSGGAYGLESLVQEMNPGWAVVLVLVTPLMWALPTAFMVAELASAMPEEGGYYHWVRTAMGDFWGVQEGWWTICYTAVDMAIYPVLFVNYLAFFVPQLALDENGGCSWSVFWLRWGIATTVIGCALGVNLLGARAVGNNALASILLVLIPFGLLSVLGLSRSGAVEASWGAVVNGLTQQPDMKTIGVGFSVVLWNYCGWDNVSTYAGEVEQPQRAYPRALAFAMPLIVLAYIIPVMAGLAVTTDVTVWTESAGWPVIGQMVAGNWLGIVIAAAALVSSWALFNSQLLYTSRLPYRMACDGWLPSALAKTYRSEIPLTALLVSAGMTALFCALSFGKLVVIDILLYAAGLSLEFITLIILRIKQPDMNRPFRVPGGWPGVVAVAVLPMGMAAVVAVASFAEESARIQLLIVAGALLSGIGLYFLRRKYVIRQANKG